jgi:hypothetical protein
MLYAVEKTVSVSGIDVRRNESLAQLAKLIAPPSVSISESMLSLILQSPRPMAEVS